MVQAIRSEHRDAVAGWRAPWVSQRGRKTRSAEESRIGAPATLWSLEAQGFESGVEGMGSSFDDTAAEESFGGGGKTCSS